MTEKEAIYAKDQTAAASSIADFAAGLAVLARNHGLNTLAFLLDMARMEADEIKNSPRP
jgi:hypothetical protein